jgi:geranylgeranyl pyrophosphate synthase
MAIVQRTGGIEATHEAALHHQNIAISALDVLERNEATAALSMMAHRAVDRQG